MITITFAASKGGAGKSMLAIGIASVLHHWGKKTLVLDLDEQGSLANWITDDYADIPRPDPNILTVEALKLEGDEAAKIARVVERLGEIQASGQYEYLLIDTKGEQARLTAGIGAYSDHVLCPTNGHAIEFEPVVKTYMGLKATLEALELKVDPNTLFKVILTKQKTVEAGDIRASQKLLRENFTTIGGPLESSAFNKAVQLGTTIDQIAEAVKGVLDTTENAKQRATAKREYERQVKALKGLEIMLETILNGENS